MAKKSISNSTPCAGTQKYPFLSPRSHPHFRAPSRVPLSSLSKNCLSEQGSNMCLPLSLFYYGA
jgi:hypothetical protein